MKIYITRHSLTTWNEEKRLQGWKNSDLTKQGLEDAKRLGNYLKNQSFDGIYSSPLKRAKETAQLIFPNNKVIISKEIGSEESYDPKAASESRWMV